MSAAIIGISLTIMLALGFKAVNWFLSLNDKE